MNRTVKRAKKTISKKQISGKKRVASLTIERKNLHLLKPHPRNPRKHPEKGSAEWETLRQSLAHDYFDPIVWNKRNGMLVSGHLRTKVLIDEGVEEADVVVVSYDDKTHLARLMAANKATGSDDTTRMKELFEELRAMDDFDLSISNFTLGEIDSMFEESVSKEISLTSTYEVVAECTDEADQKRVFNLLKQKGIKCRILTL